MATNVYSNTIMAEIMSDVLHDMVQAGQLSEHLAVATLEQLTESIYRALKDQLTAKAEIQADLDTYKYLDNIWQFRMEDVSLRVNATGQGPAKHAPEVKTDKLKLVCVDIKLAGGPL